MAGTYRLQVLCDQPRGWTRDDVLAAVLRNMDTAMSIGAQRVSILGPLLAVVVTFRALHDDSAKAIKDKAGNGLPVAHDKILHVKEGRSFVSLR